MRIRRVSRMAPLVALLIAAPLPARAFDLIRSDEATIADIHAALKARALTCRALVQMYLDRIEAYDKKGPALNAIVVTNPDALKVADALDARFAQSGPVGPLHCVPVIVKDNYETTDMPTSAGSLSLKGVMTRTDAFQVKKLREAGAIMLAKSNMAEFAFDPMETVNSLLPGYTRNPYALDRVTAGSSGGTAAAVAASFGAVGLGTDTGNSIRGPAAHTSLVGIRSTMGLTSRDGIVPLFLDKDVGGPMARTVTDAVAVFDIIAGYDAADPVTAASQGKRPDSYAKFLDKDGVRGMRLGVVRQLFTPQNTDPEVMKRMEQALVDLRQLGAQIVDPIRIDEIDTIPPAMLFCFRFKFDNQRVLAPSRARRAGEDPGGHHQVREIPSLDREAATRPPGGAAADRESALRAGGAEHAADARGRPEGDGRQQARRAGLSDVGLSAAPDRRPQHATRQQQPAPVAADRIPRDHRSHGLRPRRPARRAAGPGPRVERADPDQDRVRLRAGDPTPSSAAQHPAAPVAPLTDSNVIVELCADA